MLRVCQLYQPCLVIASPLPAGFPSFELEIRMIRRLTGCQRSRIGLWSAWERFNQSYDWFTEFLRVVRGEPSTVRGDLASDMQRRVSVHLVQRSPWADPLDCLWRSSPLCLRRRDLPVGGTSGTEKAEGLSAAPCAALQVELVLGFLQCDAVRETTLRLKREKERKEETVFSSA